MAIQDILLGLEWIQSNIAAFGGNPVGAEYLSMNTPGVNYLHQKKVLLFGQSEGAQLGFIISGLPKATSLIHSLVAESGGGRDYLLTNNSAVQNFGANWAKGIGCNVTDVSRGWMKAKPSLIQFIDCMHSFETHEHHEFNTPILCRNDRR